jgi:transposase
VTQFKRIAVDTSKSVFTVHGVDESERAVLRRNLRRSEFLAFFRKLPATEVAMEACGGSHHWGRMLTEMGHTVRLIPAQYVKPFVKRGKNDRNDAEAINEATGRPGMRAVPVKSAEAQARAMMLSARELLVRQRTQLVNALRGHAAEMGLVAPIGHKGLAELCTEIACAEALPAAAREALSLLEHAVSALEARIGQIDAKLIKEAKACEASRRLAEAPGIGPITAISFVQRVDMGQFESGRHFAAWLGLVPREKSTGGKQRMGGISRAGNERLRELLVLGATSVIRHAKPGRDGVSAWLLKLLERKPRKLVAIALANKMARMIWAMLTRGEAYRAAPLPQAA